MAMTSLSESPDLEFLQYNESIVNNGVNSNEDDTQTSSNTQEKEQHDNGIVMDEESDREEVTDKNDENNNEDDKNDENNNEESEYSSSNEVASNNTSEDDDYEEEEQLSYSSNKRRKRNQKNKTKEKQLLKQKKKEEEYREKVYAEYKRKTDVRALMKTHRRDRMFQKKDYLEVLNEAKVVAKQNNILLANIGLTADVIVDTDDNCQTKEKVTEEIPLFDGLLSSFEEESSDSDFELVIEKKIELTRKKNKSISYAGKGLEDSTGNTAHEENESITFDDSPIIQENVVSNNKASTLENGQNEPTLHKNIEFEDVAPTSNNIQTESTVQEPLTTLDGNAVSSNIDTKSNDAQVVSTLEEPLPTLEENMEEIETLMEQEREAKIRILQSDEWQQVYSSEDDDENEFVDQQCEEEEDKAEEEENLFSSNILNNYNLIDEHNSLRSNREEEDSESEINNDDVEELGEFLVFNKEIAKIDEKRAKRLRKISELNEELIHSDDEEMNEENEDPEAEELRRWNEKFLHPTVASHTPSSIDCIELLKQITNEKTGTIAGFSKRTAQLIHKAIKNTQFETVDGQSSYNPKIAKKEEIRQEMKRLEEERRKNTKRLLDNYNLIKKRQKKLREQLNDHSPSMNPSYERSLPNEGSYQLSATSSHLEYDFEDMIETNDRNHSNEEQTRGRIVYRPKNKDKNGQQEILTLPEQLLQSEKQTANNSNEQLESNEEDTTLPIDKNTLNAIDFPDNNEPSAKRKRTEDAREESNANKKKKITNLTIHGKRIIARSSFLNCESFSNERAKKFAKQYKKNQKQNKEYQSTINPKPLGQFTIQNTTDKSQ